MAYRRRQGITRASTFKEEIHHPPDDNDSNKPFRSSHSFSSSSSLAAQAMRASAAHRESSLSSAYNNNNSNNVDNDRGGSSGSAFSSSNNQQQGSMGFNAYDDASKNGFWGILARKAKAILEDDDVYKRFESPGSSSWHMSDASASGQFQQPYQSSENYRRMDNPTFRRGLDKITYSLNQIGDSFEKAFEEGRTMMENETRKLQIRRKGGNPEEQNSSWQPLQPTEQETHTNHQTQLKASRDVAMATAAKAKLLLRELKTVKADLAFAKARCSQLEEENKILRDGREKGQNPADDDLIRLQLETLLAEKARLAHENSVYARENRFLREIVEYHQLTMQDVVYVDEGTEEVTEVYPRNSVSRMLSGDMLSISPPSSPPSPLQISRSVSLPGAKEIFPVPKLSEEKERVSGSNISRSSSTELPMDSGDVKRRSVSSAK